MHKKILYIAIALVLILSAYFLVRNFRRPTNSNSFEGEAAAKISAELNKNIDTSAKSDTDLDSLSNDQEKSLGSDPNVADTDGDGLIDGAEINVYKSNPLKKDTFNLGITDGAAVEKGILQPGGKIIK